jgi:hypothetical protein
MVAESLTNDGKQAKPLQYPPPPVPPKPNEYTGTQIRQQERHEKYPRDDNRETLRRSV